MSQTMQVSQLFLTALFMSIVISEVSCDYWTQRANFIQNEESKAIGNKIKLTRKEEIVNKVLMTAKRQELKRGFINPELFPPAVHFFQSRNNILKSYVFKLIKQMPKGGALHIHDTSISTTDYILYNITYRNNLYGCLNNESLKLTFADPKPNDDCWKTVKLMRDSAESNEIFDKWLRTKLNIFTEHPYDKYPDINTVWKKFYSLFDTITPMITYRPVWQDYFYHALQTFHADNVNYMEIRGTLPSVYELNGSSYNPIEVMGILKQTADKFLVDYPDFIGIKYIYAPSRACNNSTMDIYIKHLKELIRLYPDFVVGFDLVGQEDKGQPLSSFINQLSELQNINFYFHAGETKWNGMPTDMNLVDAVLLNNTRRIGHGFALLKHSSVLEQIKRRGIGIEINPISNQVLNLVKDLRNHPASILFAEDYPVVVSSDDPGFWEATPLSSDFYEAFMGLASASADLRMLKQLAYNSFLYSSLNDTEKVVAFRKFNAKWKSFIDEVVAQLGEPFCVRHA